MENTTTIKIPKKYHSMLEVVYKSEDGYFAEVNDGFCFGYKGEHIVSEDTQQELLKHIKVLKICKCEQCLEELNKGSATC